MQSVYSTETSLFFTIMPQNTDAAVPPWHENRNSIMVRNQAPTITTIHTHTAISTSSTLQNRWPRMRGFSSPKKRSVVWCDPSS